MGQELKVPCVPSFVSHDLVAFDICEIGDHTATNCPIRKFLGIKLMP